ncbi:MAG: DUF3047 domain-containing protein [Pseudomonadota bacterium]
MMRLTWGRLGTIILAVFIGLPASATVDQALIAGGWHEITFDGKDANRFAPDTSGGISVLSDNSVSLIQMPIDVDLSKTPLLSWRWQVAKPAPPSDLSTKGKDDRSLALYIAFPFVSEEASAFERFRRSVVEAIAGERAPGRVLTYVWGGNGERGERVRSPYFGDSGMITILRPASATAGQWFDETVNIAEDYRRVFGSSAPDPVSIAIGSDSDDTLSLVEGVIADVGFIASPDLSNEAAN